MFFQDLSPEPYRSLTLAHIADLVLGAFSFAMRSWEYTKSFPLGRSKRVRIGCLIFPTASCRVILLHTDLKLLHHAQYITITFENQKNGKKMDARTRSPFRSQVPLSSTALGFGSSTTVETSRRRSAPRFLMEKQSNLVTILSENCSDKPASTCSGIDNFWVSPSSDWEQVPLVVGCRYIPLPQGPLPRKNPDPWPLVFGCIPCLHLTPSVRLDK